MLNAGNAKMGCISEKGRNAIEKGDRQQYWWCTYTAVEAKNGRAEGRIVFVRDYQWEGTP